LANRLAKSKFKPVNIKSELTNEEARTKVNLIKRKWGWKNFYEKNKDGNIKIKNQAES